VRTPADIPVLLIIFNRPDKVRRVLSALREAEPAQVFIAADGPRPHSPRDGELCSTTRQVLSEIDWECEIHTLFHRTNLGCKLGPETAISWFLSQVPSGIILEDDCLPAPDFFPFCAELLDRFQACEHIMMIGGYNALGSWPRADASYLYSRTAPTWSRAWQHYDADMTAWSSGSTKRKVRARMSAGEFRIVRRLFDRVHDGTLDAWDYAWSFAMLRTGGLSIVPATNLVENIGFDEAATHTKNRHSADARVATYRMTFPLVHPSSTAPSSAFEAALRSRRFPIHRQILTLLPMKWSNLLRFVFYRYFARFMQNGAAGTG
jgi:hypothetical protein